MGRGIGRGPGFKRVVYDHEAPVAVRAASHDLEGAAAHLHRVAAGVRARQAPIISGERDITALHGRLGFDIELWFHCGKRFHDRADPDLSSDDLARVHETRVRFVEFDRGVDVATGQRVDELLIDLFGGLGRHGVLLLFVSAHPIMDRSRNTRDTCDLSPLRVTGSRRVIRHASGLSSRTGDYANAIVFRRDLEIVAETD